MSVADAVKSEADNELTLFLEAVKEANRHDDSKHLESEVEVKNACKYEIIKRTELRKRVICSDRHSRAS